MRTTSRQKTKFDTHSRENLKKVNGEESALVIEMMFILQNYRRSTQENALVKMIEIVRGTQNDTDRINNRVVTGEDKESKHPES